MSSKFEIVESESVRGAYDMRKTHAIIREKATGKNYYISEGFGGMDSLRGGMYRWEHGGVVELPDWIDTLEKAMEWDESAPMCAGFAESEGTPTGWDEKIVLSIAKSLGL
jgi:hypothetical protein